MRDLIDRNEAIKALCKAEPAEVDARWQWQDDMMIILDLPSAQPERLSDDDFETIRIHLNAYKEELCNQRRWKEAEEYQRIIDRFMAFASAQPEQPSQADQNYEMLSKVYNMRDLPDEVYSIVGDVMLNLHGEERKTGRWIKHNESIQLLYGEARGGVKCSECGYTTHNKAHVLVGCPWNYCPNCGAKMRGNDNG